MAHRLDPLLPLFVVARVRGQDEPAPKMVIEATTMSGRDHSPVSRRPCLATVWSVLRTGPAGGAAGHPDAAAAGLDFGEETAFQSVHDRVGLADERFEV